MQTEHNVLPEPAGEGDQLAYIALTSGTTGTPKGVYIMYLITNVNRISLSMVHVLAFTDTMIFEFKQIKSMLYINISSCL